jgi:SAM-dependent methyltransferase
VKSKTDVFDDDVRANHGYVYTTNGRLSSNMATRRLADLVQGVVRLEGRSVVDIGCGDGFFTELYRREAGPRRIVGVDGAAEAVRVAQRRSDDGSTRFVASDGHHLPWRRDAFDVALIQGVLHHDDDPRGIIREALRVASEVVILEPNGANYGLKVIEKASRYHREHQERSYPSGRVIRWIGECGGVVVRREFGGLVPMFCPDTLARLCKSLEPRVERSRLLSVLGCAVYVLVAHRATA